MAKGDMAMKLLGRATSGNVQKVLFLLEEIGADYTREDYGRQFGNTATDEYLAMNPTGKVPTLVDGDVVVWESHSILRYAASKLGSDLYPGDPATRADVERWMDWLLATLNATYVTLFKATKDGGEGPAFAVTELGSALGLLDGQLGKHDYLAGSALSLADIAMAPIVHRCLGFPVARPDVPNVAAWHDRIAARPAFKKAIGGG